MKLHRFVFNPVEENTYLLWDEQTLEAAVVDAGMRGPKEETEFADYVQQNKLSLKECLQTHMHFDHIYGLPFIYERFGLKPRFSERDAELYSSMPGLAEYLHIPIQGNLPQSDSYLSDGEVIRLGNVEIATIFTPGHTMGGVTFHIPQERIAFTGDTLFCGGSMGRTDIGGDEAMERKSILDRILTLSPDTILYPGHGPSTIVSDVKDCWGIQ